MPNEEVKDPYTKIKYFRLVNGDNIITEVKRVYKGKLSIVNPMVIAIDPDFEAGKQTIYMHLWMPQGIAKGNQCNLNTKDIIFSADVENDIIEYYTGTIKDLSEEDAPVLAEKKPNEYVDGDKKVVRFSRDTKNIPKDTNNS
jgi:hypothetical protein